MVTDASIRGTIAILLGIVTLLNFAWGMHTIWVRRRLPGSRSASLLISAATLWIIASIGEFVSPSAEIQVWWVRLEWVCWSIVPSIWLVYGLFFNDWIQWKNWGHLLLIGIVPTIVFIFFLTNARHQFLYELPWVEVDISIPMFKKTLGPASWAYVIYSYILLAFGFFAILYKLIRSKKIQFWQAIFVAMLVIATWIIAFLNNATGFEGWPEIDLSPIALVISIPVFIWTASRRQSASLSKYSLDSVFESLNTAIFLLGANDKVEDLNRSGQQLVKKSVSHPQEKYLHEIVDFDAGELDLSNTSNDSAQKISLIIDGDIRTYQTNLSLKQNWLGQISGKILALSDITEQERYLQETSALLEISTAVSSSLNFQEVLLIMVERLLKLSNFNLCEVYEWDEESNKLFLLIEHGRAFWPEDGSDVYSLDEWPIEKAVLQNGEPYFGTYDSEDVDSEGYSNSWIIPIRANHQPIGYMEVSYVREISQNPGDILSICETLLSEAAPLFMSFDNLPGERVLELAEQVLTKTQANECAISKWNRSENTVETVASVSHSSWERFQGLKYDADIWPSATKALQKSQWSVISREDTGIIPAELEDLYEWNSQITVVMPISIKGRTLGLVEIYKIVDDGPIPKETLQLWKHATDQAAIAFENARLFDQTQRSLSAQLALSEASNVIVSEVKSEVILSQLAAQVCGVARATSVYICEFNEEKTSATVIAEYFSPEAGTSESDLGKVYPIWDDAESFINKMEIGLHDYSHIDELDSGEEEIAHMQAFGTKSILYVPLLMKGQLIGFIEIWDSLNKREFTPEETRLCTDISRSAAVALENARLLEQAQEEIVERKKAEQTIKESLLEKEILLQEIHHRVKNNLQIISSMLNLQSDQTSNPAVSEFVTASQGRINSMAMIHEMLYQSKNLAQVKFDDYVQQLVRHFRETATMLKKQVWFDVDIEELFLNIDTAIQCGLILNELVSNALKHAFPEDRRGCIQILFSKNSQGYSLHVQDDGIGLSEDINFTETKTLGYHLVTALVHQLHGEISIDRSEGTRYTITFEGATRE